MCMHIGTVEQSRLCFISPSASVGLWVLLLPASVCVCVHLGWGLLKLRSLISPLRENLIQ